MNRLDELRESVEHFSTAPTMRQMPRLTLRDKGIDGPTGAHRIEEIHTPLNFGFLTTTTGTTAFQNIVGMTGAEIPDRVAAAGKVFSLCGMTAGDEALFSYPPLVNVFPRQALEEAKIKWSFLAVSSRDALLLAVIERRPKVVFGESSFLRVALQDAKKMGILDELPRGLILVTAGTPLDLDLLPRANEIQAVVHDLYGCQEFGWLTLDGIALREDLALLPAEGSELYDLVVGGLPTGDRFPVADSGHVCNANGKILTYARRRTAPDMVTTVLQSTASSLETVNRAARTILRIKAKIVRVAPNCATGADRTVLSVAPFEKTDGQILTGPVATRMFDSLLEAQKQYQANAKNDPVWNKTR